MPSRNTVQIVINAEDNASSVLKNVVGELQSIGEVALSIGAAALASATAAVVGFGAASLDAFKDFSIGMNEVFTLLPGITEDAMRQMESSVQSFMEQTGRLSSETIPALYQALSAGVPQDNVFDFLTVANKAAVGGVTDLETAVDGITSILNAYGLSAEHATEVSDAMFTAVRIGKTTFAELSDSAFQLIPVMAGVGGSYEDALAAVTALTAQGVPTSVAFTQVRQAVVELSDAGTEVGAVFEQLAGQSFQDFLASGHDLADAFALLETEATRLDVPISQLFGSVEAGNAALALTGAGMETFRGNIEAMANSAGATEAAFNTMNQGIGMALNRLGARWESLLISMGRLIEPFVTPIVEAFSTIVAYIAATLDTGDAFNDWLSNLPMWLRPAVFFLGEMAVWILEAAEAFGSFVAAINAGVPFLTAFQTFLYNVAGFDVAYYFGQFAAAAQEFFTQVMTVLQPVIDWVAANIELQDVLIALGIAIASVVIPAVIAFFAAFAPLVLLIGAIAALRIAWENDFMGMRTAIEAAWVVIQPILEDIGTFIQGLWDAFQTGGFTGAATFIQDNLITPIMEQIAAVDWGAVALSIFTFLGNALLTFMASAAQWTLDNILIPLKDGMVAGIEGIDWYSVGETIMTFIGDALKTGLDWVAWVINSIFNPITENTDEATGQVDWGGVAQSIFNAIQSAVWAVIDFAQWLVDTVFLPMATGASQAIQNTDWAAVGQGIMDAIAGAIPDIMNWVQTNIIGPIQSALGSFNPLASVGGNVTPYGTGTGAFNGANGGFGAGIQPVNSGRQFGGAVTGGLAYTVGEQGPETFVPNSDGQILNNRDTELAGQGGKGINITMYISGSISDRDAKESAYKLKRELQAQGFEVNG